MVTTWDYAKEKVKGDLADWLKARRGAGMSYAKIAKLLTDLGCPVSTTTVHRWMTKGESNGKI